MDENAAVGTHGTPHRSDLGRKATCLDACDGQGPCGTAVTELLTPIIGTERRLLGLAAVFWDSGGVSGTLWTAETSSAGVESAGFGYSYGRRLPRSDSSFIGSALS